MQTTRSFLRSTLAMLAVGIIILLGIVAASLWLVQKNSDYSDMLAELRRIRSGSIDLLTTVQDAETGQRGYLLSQDLGYLKPYDMATQALPAKRQRLREVTAGRPDYADKLGALDVAIDQKMAELKQTVDLTKAGRLSDALVIVKGNSGFNDMTRIHDTLTDFISRTDDRLRTLVVDQLAAADNLKWVTIGGAIAILLVLAGAVFLIFNYVRALSMAREEVLALNAGLEERIDERTQDLVRANQEIQRFAYIVTHDLRAPLVNIMGFLSELESSLKAVGAYVMLEDRAAPEGLVREARLAVQEDLPEAVGFIRSSTRKMDALINAILKISRDGQRKLQPERIDLKSLIETTADSVHHQTAEGGGSVDISVRSHSLVSDRASLDQIFGNLLDNAVKYQMPGRALRVSIRAYPAGRGHIRIDVEDNGRGIDDNDRERVFELFRRAGEQDQAGEGIGLAYVRSLVRGLGGDVTVESKLNIGSTFIVTLPDDITKIVRSVAA